MYVCVCVCVCVCVWVIPYSIVSGCSDRENCYPKKHYRRGSEYGDFIQWRSVRSDLNKINGAVATALMCIRW